MDSTQKLYEILDDYKTESITSTHAVKLINEVMVEKLNPYIGEDYDNARKILLR